VLHEVWQRVAQQQREVLASVTLAELVDRLRDAPAGMYYI
jgi:DNA-binding IscR family transcriptional regulator